MQLLAKTNKLYINKYIKEDYSPEQIVGVAKKKDINCVSHERIYQYLWQDKRQGGKNINTYELKVKDTENGVQKRISEE